MMFLQYYDTIKIADFMHIPFVSVYNSNYYKGFDSDLLYGKSDDDNTTEWFIIKNECFYYLGESYESEGNILHRFEERQT